MTNVNFIITKPMGKKRRKPKKHEGICKLTNEHGTFVKSHLIPEALTRPAQKGSPLVQYGNKNQKPIRRWTSWYDTELVTRKGEDILTEYDTWAINALKENKLIWSGWEESNSLTGLQDANVKNFPGFRIIQNFNSERLRLFFLSLLWRAAASSLKEFSEIVLPTDDLEKLRVMLVSRNHEPLYFYPITLLQLSTKGVIHNQSPILDVKIVPSFIGEQIKEIPIYRFYFDGLIAHIHIQNTDDGTISELGSLIVGSKEELFITTQTYENSFEKENLIALLINR